MRWKGKTSLSFFILLRLFFRLFLVGLFVVFLVFLVVFLIVVIVIFALHELSFIFVFNKVPFAVVAVNKLDLGESEWPKMYVSNTFLEYSSDIGLSEKSTSIRRYRSLSFMIVLSSLILLFAMKT